MVATSKPVLIVDDDQSIRDALSELFQSEGYNVATAHDGLNALGQLRRGLQPCAIILDLMMPVMDGWDFRSEQLGDPALKDIPVVVITAVGFSAETVKTQLGAVEFVPKPPPPDRLMKAVERLCAAN